MAWQYWTGRKRFEPEYQAVLDYAKTNSIPTPSSSINHRNNERVKRLKNDNLWNNFDILYFFDQESGRDDFAKINYIDPSLFFITSPLFPTFVSDSGFKSNGTSEYLNTNYNPVTDQNNLTNTSAMIVYIGFDFIANSNVESIVGSRTGNNTSQFFINKDNATQSLFRISPISTISSFTTVNNNNAIVFSGTTSSAKVYENGIRKSNDPRTMTGSGFTSLPLFLLAVNLSGSPTFIANSGLKVFGIGSSIGTEDSNTNAVNLSNILRDIP